MASFVLFVALAGLAHSAPKYLVLSGGGNPAANHYSQYLQTKLLYNELVSRWPERDIRVLFGSGLKPGDSARYADVNRIAHEEDGTSLIEMIPGEISENIEASQENIESYFNDNLTPPDEDPLFLIVSDHGMPNRPAEEWGYTNNCIHLWKFDVESFSTGPFDDSCLSREELTKLLPTDRRVVFAMSQCYSGGFHRMSVTESEGGIRANPNVCGFTAATEDHIASGCSPDVDGPGYEGYERYFTQRLTAKDVVSGENIHERPADSPREAHELAMLDDFALDTPISTSDYFLGRWADRFSAGEAKVYQAALDMTLTEEEASAALDGAAVKDLAEARDAFAARYRTALLERRPELAEVVVAGYQKTAESRAEFLAQRETLLADSDLASNEAGQLSLEAIAPKWSTAIETGDIALTSEERRMEERLYLPFELDPETSAFADELIEHFLLLNLAEKWAVDREVYEAARRYHAKRAALRATWVATSGDTELQNAWEKREKALARATESGDQAFALDTDAQLLRRALIQLETRAALLQLASDRDPSLEDLKGLAECEATGFEN